MFEIRHGLGNRSGLDHWIPYKLKNSKTDPHYAARALYEAR